MPLRIKHKTNHLLCLLFCALSCRAWLYPAAPPPREYQFSIAWTASQHNTLACLPTGLGKTLIAAVVMYNFYRWFPTVRFRP